jgi:hypothetical protein
MTTPPIISLPPDPPAYFVWLYSALLAACIGGFDYLTKGLATDAGRWIDLPKIMQGYSWGVIMLTVYGAGIALIAVTTGHDGYWCGLILFANEDMAYWSWRYLLTGKKAVRLPMNLNRNVYFGWIIVSNIFVFLLT